MLIGKLILWLLLFAAVIFAWEAFVPFTVQSRVRDVTLKLREKLKELVS